MSRTMFLPFGGDIFRDHQMWGQGDRMDRFWPLRHRFFYRATRMHSADYAVARYPSVRPSVCHTPVFCLNGRTDPVFFTVG